MLTYCTISAVLYHTKPRHLGVRYVDGAYKRSEICNTGGAAKFRNLRLGYVWRYVILSRSLFRKSACWKPQPVVWSYPEKPAILIVRLCMFLHNLATEQHANRYPTLVVNYVSKKI